MSRYQEIKNLFDSENDNLVHIGMNKVALLQADNKTTIYTDSIATCIGLGIVAIDNNDVIHRIVSHNYAYSEGFQIRQLESIEEYLKSIPTIKELKVTFCSMDSFNDLENMDEIEQEAFTRINNTFNFYREQHPEFHINFSRSWYIMIPPTGNIDYADVEMLQEYLKENKGKKL